MVSVEQMLEFEASMKSQFATFQGLQEASDYRVVEALHAQALRETIAIDVAATAQFAAQGARVDTAVLEKLQGIDARIGGIMEGGSTQFSAEQIRVGDLVATL